MRGQRTGKHVSDRILGRSASWQLPGRIHRPAARCRRERRVDRLPAATRRHCDLLPGDSPLKIQLPMKHLLQPILSFLFAIFSFLLSLPVAAQSLSQDLTRFAETPAVPGYEQALAAEIRAQMGKLSPQSDNLGNLYVTLGSRETSGLHRLIVAPMDEPGYVVSGITDDGYLRVQRLPQTAPHPLFDLLHAAQPVVIHTRKRKWIPGVVAGLSTHLQPGRQNFPRGAHPDEIYIDIGASSAAEVHQAGVDLLDPIALDRKLYAMGFGRMTAPAVGRPLRLRGAGGTAAADRPSKAARQAHGCVCHP